MTDSKANMSHSPDDDLHEITRVLGSLEKGEDHTKALIPLVYNQLRYIAMNRLAHEPSGQTLQATALVHETYLRLTKSDGAVWHNRRHFFGAATEAMRRILIENARRKQAAKRGGGLIRAEADVEGLSIGPTSVEILDLDEALSELEELDPNAAELVKLRYFAGLTTVQIADVLDVSERTVRNIWVFAQAWLYRKLKE